MDDKIKEVMGLVIAMSDADFAAGVRTENGDYAGAAEKESESSKLERLIESKLREMVPAWLPIDAAPVNRTVLLGFRNENGNWRSTRGAWMDEVEIASWENDDYPVGWYETPVEGEECFYIEPTHWMPLPKEPS